MTFKKFESLFFSKYPNGEVVQHGKFAGTDKNMKVTIIFDNNIGKVYQYYGSYQTILAKLGINVLYKTDIELAKKHLDILKEQHGTEGFFGDILDCTEEIQKYEDYIAESQSNRFIII